MSLLSHSKLLCACLGGLAAALYSTSAAAADPPPHVLWSELLINTVLPENNEYATQPSYIHWVGEVGTFVSENRTVCGTFVTLLYQRSYMMTNADFSSWMGTTSPDGAQYHDAIVAQNGFQRIDKVGDLLPGDLIAIKYPDGSTPTGHVMLVVAAVEKFKHGKPVVQGTKQYEVIVHDSTNFPHGPTDSRVEVDGSLDTGAGRGPFRLYTDAHGNFVGHTWSTAPTEDFYDQSSRHLVVGRLARLIPTIVLPGPGLPSLPPIDLPIGDVPIETATGN